MDKIKELNHLINAVSVMSRIEMNIDKQIELRNALNIQLLRVFHTSSYIYLICICSSGEYLMRQ